MDRERLRSGLEAMHIVYDDAALDRFQCFHEVLDEYNQHMDLTAVLDEQERIDRHDLDSASILGVMEIPRGSRIADVGTGAGFPGIPLLILRPDLNMTLLDAQQKRCGFLQEALKRLELSADVVHTRAEEAGRNPLYREQFDYAVSRAVASMGVLQELLLPLVRPGGYAVAWKGPKGLDEQESARRAAFLLGGEYQKMIRTEIPHHEDWTHILLVTAKTGNTPSKYPRQSGKISGKPLA